MGGLYSRLVRMRRRPIEADRDISFEGTNKARMQADPGVADFILDSGDELVPVAEQKPLAPSPEWNAVEQPCQLSACLGPFALSYPASLPTFDRYLPPATDTPPILSTEGAISFQLPFLPQVLTNDSILLCPSGEELGHTGSADTSSEQEEAGSEDGDMVEHAAMSHYEDYEREDRVFSAHDLLDTLLAQPESDHSDPGTPRALDLHQEVLIMRLSGPPNHLSSPDRIVNAFIRLNERNPRPTHPSEYTELLREALMLVQPGHPQRPFVLQMLALAVISRFNRTGEESDLSEGIERHWEVLMLFPPGHPQRSYALEHLACAILGRYDQSGEESDLSVSIKLNRERLDLQPRGHSDRSTALTNLADAILKRHERYGDDLDLSEVIKLRKKALHLQPPGHSGRLNSLIDLSDAVLVRYNRDGSESDLSKFIDLNHEVLAFQPPGHPYRLANLKNLAAALSARYERNGRASDLLKIIKLHQGALTLQPHGHPDRWDSLSQLAMALLVRYECEGRASDLSEAIKMQRQVLALQPTGHPDYSSSLNNLGKALLVRYNSSGEGSDLSEVINLQREALNLQPAGHPQRSSTLDSLASSLLSRYRHDNEASDLSEAIKIQEQALDLLPPGHSLSLSNLASALIWRYTREGAASDLLRGIDLFRKSLESWSSDHPNRSISLNNLAKALLMRYEVLVRSWLLGKESDLLKLKELQELEDPDDLDDREALDEIIELHEEALSLRPPGHPRRSETLRDLGSAYLQEFLRSPDSRSALLVAVDYEKEALDCQPAQDPHRSEAAILLVIKLVVILQCPDSFVHVASNPPSAEQIVDLLRMATNAETSPIPERLRAAMRWITVAIKHHNSSVLDAYHSAITHLGSAVRLGRSLQARHNFLFEEEPATISLARSAACWAIADTHGSSKVAIELLDQGRNVLLSSVGQFRGDLSDVRQQDPALADNFYQTSRILDNAILKDQDAFQRRSFHEDLMNCYKRISADWQDIVNKIRLLPNCESFLLPEPYAKLQEAAAGGPVIVVIVGEKESTAIIITSHGDPHTINLPDASEDALKTLYEEWEAALKTLPDESRVRRKLPKVLSQLWDILAQPIIQELADRLCVPRYSRIWWYPTSWASFLPLHAAGTYKKGGLNVPDCYISSYTPTLQALRRARRNYLGPGLYTQPSLVVSQPRTEGQDEIEYVDKEVEVVGRLVQGTLSLSGSRGTKENVLEEMRNHSWIHLACHGVPDLTKPFQSHFALHDGPLSLQDIISDDLPFAEFAYLSACHTAAQDRTLPDEGLTLAGGMLFAGFKSVVGTLWKMADEDAPGLAKDFYEELARRSEDGKGFDCTKTAEALHEAVRKLREKKVPLFRWVNLVHYGI